MERETQISAPVTQATRDLLDRHVRATGMKKGYVVEMALRHHLQALQELPLDVIMSPRLVVSSRTGKEISDRIATPARPTKALRDLMKADGNPRAPRR